jgi:glucose-6-phosphate 1-dehydrogenase
MLQNHLLQLLCLTAVEPPVSYSPHSLRNELVKVLEAIDPPKPGDWALGQYDHGRVDGRETRSYREERGVGADSNTPTFVAARLAIDNWRWSGVPFFLRTGKRMARRSSEVSVLFKSTPHVMFPGAGSRFDRYPNVLTFRLQPDEGIVQTFLAKRPGPSICLSPVTMTLRYDKAFGIERPPSAYEWLILDVVQGDQTLFPRSDWIYKAWSIVEPMLGSNGGESAANVERYQAGTWGPEAADVIPGRTGRSWLDNGSSYPNGGR